MGGPTEGRFTIPRSPLIKRQFTKLSENLAGVPYLYHVLDMEKVHLLRTKRMDRYCSGAVLYPLYYYRKSFLEYFVGNEKRKAEANFSVTKTKTSEKRLGC